ncbi:hypothetical protein Tco_1228479 [Tanacetum coccineum]
MAFMSSPSSTNEVNTAYGVSTTNTQVRPASTQVSTASTQVSTANLSDDTVYAFFCRVKPNGSSLVYEDIEQIHEDDIEKLDLKWQYCIVNKRTRRFSPENCFETLKTQLDDLRIEFNKSEFNLATYKRGLASVEEQLVFYKKNEVIFYEQLAVLKRDISYKDSEISMLKRLFSPPKFDLSNSGLEEFQQPEFEGYGPKTSKSVSENISNEVRESPDTPLVEKLVSDDKLEKKIVSPTVAKIEFVRPKQQEKPVRKPVKYAEMYRSQSPRGNQRNWNNQKSQQLGSDFVMYNKACFVCGSFDHVQANCNYHQRERVVSGNNYTRVNYNYSAKKAHPSAHRNMVPRAVLMKTGLRSLNTARPVNTAHPKTTIPNPTNSSLNEAKKTAVVTAVTTADAIGQIVKTTMQVTLMVTPALETPIECLRTLSKQNPSLGRLGSNFNNLSKKEKSPGAGTKVLSLNFLDYDI